MTVCPIAKGAIQSFNDDLDHYFEIVDANAGLVRFRSQEPSLASPKMSKGEMEYRMDPTSCPRSGLLHRLRCEGNCYHTTQISIRNYHTMEDLVLPYGAPQWDVNHQTIILPEALQRTGSSHIIICQDPDTHGHYLFLEKEETTHDFLSVYDLMTVLRRMDPVTLQALLVPGTWLHPTQAVITITSPTPVRVCVCVCTHTPCSDLHAILCFFVAYLNPMMTLDEVVSFGVATCMLLKKDNRTMAADHTSL